MHGSHNSIEKLCFDVNLMGTGQNCTKGQFCTNTTLHGGSILHESKKKIEKRSYKKRTEKKTKR